MISLLMTLIGNIRESSLLGGGIAALSNTVESSVILVGISVIWVRV